MQVTVEKVSSVQRRLTITVPANQVEAAYAKQINQFAKKANIKGFRPGKAPVSYVQERFGKEVRQEALSDIIRTALQEAIEQENLNPISQPQIEPKLMEKNQPLEFVVSFEVMPEVEKIHFTLDKIEKFVVEVTSEDVDRAIQQLRKQHATWTNVDRPAQDQDRVVIDYHAVFEGQSEDKVEDFTLELGSNTMLPGFEEGLKGAKADEERTLHLIFPADLPDAEKANKPVDFVVKVKQVYEVKMPALDEAFIKELGIESGKEEALKNQVKEALEREKERLVKEKLKAQVFDHLLEQNPLEIPASLIKREAHHLHDEVYPAHQAHDHHHSDEEMALFNEIAKKRVNIGLLIAAYAKQVNLKVEDHLVNQRIEEIASTYQHPQTVITWLSSQERRAGIETQLIEDLVMEKLMEGIPLIEKTISYAELKGTQI